MTTDKSGAGYGNHGGDETYQDNRTQQGDQARDFPDDSGKGDDDEEDEDRAAGR